ncbi:MAG TPA: isoprenylcysteine carboxylmethyltransferase family protein [Candidatus Polarisedimenticolia bacterium]|nr:isoprenylcysteine carboxylmethyltransferase family protein [Candidatus Polarisedimenticolia bacterium]
MDTRARERIIDLSLGYASLALFAASIATLIWFLLSIVNQPEERVDAIQRELFRATDGRGDPSATFDALLILAWGFLHSFMARPRFKTNLQKVLRPHRHAAVYSLVASAGLIALCLLYRPIPRQIYALEGGAALITRLLFWLGWALFLYCWLHLDLLEVVGLRPILRNLASQPTPPAPFRPTGPFLWVRHPVELAFLIVFWAAPGMTVGHLLFASLMTLYTFIGADFEERRMLDLYGATYAEYMKQVPQIVPLPH